MQPQARVVVQARMGSGRFPGKILAPLGGRMQLQWVLAGLQAAPVEQVAKYEVWLATTDRPLDEVTAAWCREWHVPCFRGHEHDVLARYVACAADLADDDLLIRATADNPWYCPQRLAAIVAQHLQFGGDYTCIENLSYVVPEVMRVGALRAMAALATEPAHREHVTMYFRTPDVPFRVQQLPATWHGLRPELRFTLDTPADRERLEAVWHAADRFAPPAQLARLYAAADQQGLTQ